MASLGRNVQVNIIPQPYGIVGPQGIQGPTGPQGNTGSVVSVNGLTGVITNAVFQYGSTLYVYEANPTAPGLGYKQTVYSPSAIKHTIVNNDGSTSSFGYELTSARLNFNFNPAEIRSDVLLQLTCGNVLVFGTPSDPGKTTFYMKNDTSVGYFRATDQRGGTFESFVQINRDSLPTSGQSALQINGPLGKNIRIFNNARVLNTKYVDIDASSTGDLNVFPVGGTAIFASNITATGNIKTTQILEGNTLSIFSPFTPASSTAPGNTGTIAWDSNYFYVCVGTNTWKRTGLTSW